ncbi:MAG: GtrA family protein [Caldisericia bacterium]|jgi:putative flippase GtrA|nr:GtrA family protein [Caldisericia bacterium]MDD5689278.1 GtrA family protein [Caldisericia bacterium]
MEIKELIKRNKRIIFFFAIGFMGALVNILIIYLYNGFYEPNTLLAENIGNFLGIEISTLICFILNRQFTWSDRPKLNNQKLLRQIIIYHLAVGISIIIRLIIFPLIQFTGLDYISNTLIGITIGAIINYFMFDKIVFRVTQSNYNMVTK